MNKKLTIALLAGGNSSEREVSLSSGREVAKALRELGHKVLELDPAVDLEKMIKQKESIDLVFPALHGKYGEDGAIQGFCELLNLPYVGCGILASALSIDKEKTIEIYRRAGLPTAKSIVFAGEVDFDRVKREIGFPCVIKPVSNGSSIGVEIIDSEEDFLAAFNRSRRLENRVLVEQYVKGRELTVGVIGNDSSEALPVLEIKPKNKFFDYEAKYNGQTEELVPIDISKKILKRSQDYAIRAHIALGCRGLSRTDFIMRGEELILLETNTMPGMTSESLLPKADQAAGKSFKCLIQRLIHLALEGKNGSEC